MCLSVPALSNLSSISPRPALLLILIVLGQLVMMFTGVAKKDWSIDPLKRPTNQRAKRVNRSLLQTGSTGKLANCRAL